MSKEVTLLSVATLVALAVVLGWIWFAYLMPPEPDLASVTPIQRAQLQIEHYKIRQEAVRILVVGLVVGLAAVIFPTIIGWNRERFERYKESRQTYTRASTGVHYLPQRLAALDYPEAMQMINEVHEYKHIAETYDELEDQVSRRSGNKTRVQWSDNMWKTLESYQEVVSKDPDGWDGDSRKDRLQKLESARAALKQEIGETYFI